MKRKTDFLYSIGFSFVTIIFTIILCLMTVYYVIGIENAPPYMIIQHIILSKKEIFLASSLYAAPYVCTGIYANQWFPIFTPMLSSMPFLLQLAGEFDGFYRMKLVRMSFWKYWNKVFLKVGLSGSCSVTIGYIIFSAIVSIYFPKPNEYPIGSAIQFNSAFNKLFNTQSTFAYWLSQAVVIFTFIFFVSQICLFIFLLCMNRYKAIGLPMIGFYLFDQLSIMLYNESGGDGRYYIISPKNILFFTGFTFESWNLNYWWYFVFIFWGTATLYLIGMKICRRRVMI